MDQNNDAGDERLDNLMHTGVTEVLGVIKDYRIEAYNISSSS